MGVSFLVVEGVVPNIRPNNLPVGSEALPSSLAERRSLVTTHPPPPNEESEDTDAGPPPTVRGGSIRSTTSQRATVGFSPQGARDAAPPEVASGADKRKSGDQVSHLRIRACVVEEVAVPTRRDYRRE